MHDSKYLDMLYHELLEECTKAFDSPTITSKQSSLVDSIPGNQNEGFGIVIVLDESLYRCCNALAVLNKILWHTEQNKFLSASTKYVNP